MLSVCGSTQAKLKISPLWGCRINKANEEKGVTVIYIDFWDEAGVIETNLTMVK